MGLPQFTDHELLRAQAQLALEDPWYLATEILTIEDEVPRTPGELKPIYNWIFQPRPDRLPKTQRWLRFWSSSRHTAKTYITCVYIFSRILKDPNIAVIIQAQEKQMAVDSVKLLRDWFENPKIVQLYGKFKSDDWGKEEFTIAQRKKSRRDPTVRALGLDVPMQGKRCDFMAWDDLIGETNNNDEGILKVEQRIAASIPVIRPGGEALYICTRWNPYDPSTDKFTIGGQPGILRQWQMHGNWDAPLPRGYFGAYAQPGDEQVFPDCEVGKPLFPGVLSERTIAEMKATMPYGTFASQILNDPIPDEMNYFTEDDLQHFDPFDEEGERSDDLVGCTYFMAVDPASGKPPKRGVVRDDTAFCVMGVKWQKDYPIGFLVEWIGGIWKPDRIYDTFFHLLDKWHPRQIFAETNIGREYFLEPIRKRGRELGLDHIPIRDIHQSLNAKTSGTKDARIGSMQEVYAYKRIWHARSLKNSKGEDQMLRWQPNGAGHDDWIDVLATCWINATHKRIASSGDKPKIMSLAAPQRYKTTGV